MSFFNNSSRNESRNNRGSNLNSTNTDQIKIISNTNSNTAPKNTVECIVFLDDYSFCTGCWSGFITMYVVNQGSLSKEGEIKIGIPITKMVSIGSGNLLVGTVTGSTFIVDL